MLRIGSVVRQRLRTWPGADEPSGRRRSTTSRATTPAGLGHPPPATAAAPTSRSTWARPGPTPFPHIHLDLYAHDQRCRGGAAAAAWAPGGSRTGPTPTSRTTSSCSRTRTATVLRHRHHTTPRRSSRDPAARPDQLAHRRRGPAGRARHPHRAGLAHRHHRRAGAGRGRRGRRRRARVAPRARGRPTCSTPATSSTGSRRGAHRRQRARPRRRRRCRARALFAAGLGWPDGRARSRWSRSCPPRCSSTSGVAACSATHPGCGEGRAACDARLCRRRWHQGASAPAPAPRPGGLKGGSASASAVLEDGTTVGALVAVNAVGAPYDPATGELLAAAPRPRRGVRRHRDAGRGRAEQGARRPPRPLRRGTHAPGDGDHDRRHRHGRDAHQGAVPEGQRARPRRPRPGDQPGAHPPRRRHALHAWRRASARPPTWLGCTR